MNRIVIIGASVGGVKSAQALRAAGFDGEIVVIEQEDVAHPYDKPPLSKSYLSSESDIGSIPLADPSDLEALGATWRFGVEATGLDPGKRTVRLSDGSALEYDAIIIATGSRARPSPWAGGRGIHLLRSSGDADRLRAEFRPGRRLVIVGGGFIGLEVAATAAKAGLEVTLIDPLPAPMSRVLNEEIGRIFLDKHAAEGILTIFGQGVEAVEQVGEEIAVSLSNGQRLASGAALVGIGAIVNTEWLTGSGIVLDDGVVCDDRLRARNTTDVYAVGDVCRWQSPEGATTRLEHWTNAADQAVIVAHNILNPEQTRSHSPVEYVWSDQFDWKIQVVGRTGATGFTLVGDPADDRFAVVYSEDATRVTGAVIVNWPKALIASRRAVAAGADAAQLVETIEGLRAKAIAPAAP